MQHVALILDTPNRNFRYYSKEVVENSLIAVKELIKEDKMFITAQEPPTTEVPLNDVVATVKDVFIDNNKLVVDFEFLKDNPLANAVHQELNRGNVSLTTNGTGAPNWNTIGKWYEILDFRLINFCFTYYPS